LAAAAFVLLWGAIRVTTRAQVAPRPALDALAKASLAQHSGTIMVRGLSRPVEVLRDTWGVPHIYARSTADLFFAQGFVVAQDRMWQLEMWRRNGEGRLAEVLGPAYVTRDKFARLLAFRGDWDEEFRKYHPEGKVIFASFAAGVNAAIQKAIDERKVPVEFEILGFQPQPVWTATTILTRMPGWTLSRNASSEVARALDIKALGAAKVEELKPLTPPKTIEVPPGLDLGDIDASILDITRGANDIRWSLKADLGSNNWVVSGAKSATGGPILANDPHREVVNPALRYVVHLVAPGWNALGATEPGLPGVSIGHNEKLAWGFTILGMDQQDLYVEEIDPGNPDRYLYKGEWLDMQVERELIFVKGQAAPVEYTVKLTRHGPVLAENAARHRAFALKWVGAEPGGAGYLGSLNVMQAAGWKEFNDALPKAWYIPSHSLVYADTSGNIGYRGVALTPIRKGWDGLLPVPGKDGKYEWDGYVPYDRLPYSFNSPKGFYNSSNNDVVPRILPGFAIPLGYEYSAPYRYDRVAEALSTPRKFTVGDFEKLQHDAASLPAREVVPLLRGVRTEDPDLRWAIAKLLSWNFVLDRESDTATIYEFWMLKLGPLAYAPRVPETARATFRQYDMRRVIAWMKVPDAAYGSNGRERTEVRNRILLDALGQGLAEIRKRFGTDPAKWKWGDVHTADFIHPLATSDETRRLFHVESVRRGGDSYTVMNTSSATESGNKQLSGASFMFVFDVKDWDKSTGLSTPGNSAQPGSPHYKDLAPYWGEGKYFPLLYSRKSVEANVKSRLVLEPLVDRSPASNPAHEPQFELAQPDLFEAAGGQCTAWGDFDNDQDPDLFVGFRRGELNKLYRNDGGKFAEIAAAVGLADANDTRGCAWGDFDADGNLDLYVGFARTSSVPNKLYRNDGNGRHFTDVARALGLDVTGETRQPSFVDYDNDGAVDLFVAFRDRPNMLFHQEGGRFVDVAKKVGVADTRKTVGAVWLDMDEDGDLDLFVANQDGDSNALYRNDGQRFADVAPTLGMDAAGRPPVYGSVGPSLADYDNDGRLDLFVAGYGPSSLWHNEGGGRFVDVAVTMGVAGDHHLVASNWGDYDNDGRPDLYAGGYLSGIAHYRDYLYHNDGGGFSEVASGLLLKHDASHGVQWVDFDQDGALDLSLADNGPRGAHFLFHNLLPPEAARRSLQVLVLDSRDRFTRAGSEVRVFAAGTRTVLGTRIVDTGSGYCSQNAMAVHLGLAAAGRVDVEVTALTAAGRKVVRVANVDPGALAGKSLVVRVGGAATTSG
jgi:penicillin amidase